MRPYRASLAAALFAVAALSAAGTYTIRLTPFPTAEVADGRSQIVVSAQVLSTDGRAVPDGTQVVFETNLGSFRESVVSTSGGWARAVLITGGVPGTARIRASVAQGDATGNTCEVEFVKSRQELSIARETIETTSTGSLLYANDIKVIEGNAPNKGSTLKYHDLEIRADELQLDLRNFVLRAKKATVRRGRRTVDYDSLFLELTKGSGYGLTNYPTTRPASVSAYPGGIALTEPANDGSEAVAQRRMRYGIVRILKDHDEPLSEQLGFDPFALANLSDSPSTIGSKRAVVYARREIQFHRADIFVNNTKIMKFPLFVVNLNSGSASPLVTDDIVNVNDNQIALNYPHYLSLKPGLTSLLRFRTGERAGQGLSGNRGAFLDYEAKWSKGDDMQGGFTFGGVGRPDWVASVNQFWRINDHASTAFQIDSPRGRSLFASGSATYGFGLYTLGLRGTQNHSLSRAEQLRNGFQNSQSYSLSFDRNPEKIGKLPVRFSYGLTAENSSSVIPRLDQETGKRTLVGYQRQGAGMTARSFTDSINLDKQTSLNGSFAATQLFGPRNYGGGLALNGTMTLNHRFSASTSALLTYNYLQDGVSEAIMGRHSLSLNGNYGLGNTQFSLWLSKGIGVDRMSLSGEASYRLTPVWRLSYSHFLSQFVGSSFSEYYFVLGYRIGWREVGLTWSSRTHRPGLQLMNVNL